MPIIVHVLVATLTGSSVWTDEAQFEKDLGKAHSLMGRGKWSKARDEILELLEQHEGATYVLVRRAELLEDLKRCSFRMENPEPDLKALVSGRLVSYKESTGSIQIEYGPDQLDDFDVEKGEGASIYIHPMVFDAGYTIEAEGTAYPDYYGGKNETFGGSPTILACIGTEASFQAMYGLPAGSASQWIPPRLRRVSDGNVDIVDEEKTPSATEHKKYKLWLQVTSNRVVVKCNGDKILESRKAAGYGRFGFANLANLKKLTVKGKIQPAWLQGLRDRVLQARLVQFEKGWDAAKVAPEWLVAGPSADATEYHEPMYPGPEKAGQTRFCNKAVDLYNSGDYADGLEFVEDLTTDDVSAEALLFLKVLFLTALDHQEEALENARELCDLDPNHLESRRRLAELSLKLLPREDAIAEFEAILVDFPTVPQAYEDLALLLLRDGRPAESKALINRAITAGVPIGRLEALNRTLVRAEKGPQWGKRYEHASKHYVVQSDISVDLCRAASRMLEEAYRSYSIRLHRIQDLERKKFKVFLFSGESSYKAYALDTLGSTPESTWGLYSSTLKQLLIWNLPDRADMMRTIRHEGFHQYLDRVMDDPPRWFNEGLAEYYEIADLVGSDWIEGQPHPHHMDRFRDRGHPSGAAPGIPVHGSGAVLRRAPGACTTLRAGRSCTSFVMGERKELFEPLFQAFRAKGNREVLEEVFGDMDLIALQTELEVHIDGLK